MRSFRLILFLALLGGCKAPDYDVGVASNAPGFSGQTPRMLASRIADADHIVVTSYFANMGKEYRDMNFLVQGETVKKIVEAIAFSRWGFAQANNIPSWTLEFYKGTNYLDVISFEGHIFNYGGVHYEQYIDGSKVLENLDAELQERVKPRQSR